MGIKEINVLTGQTNSFPEDAPIITFPPTPQELEDEVQEVANNLLNDSDHLMALAFATVDLTMAAIPPGATKAQVRQQFRDRVVFYLRERRGI